MRTEDYILDLVRSKVESSRFGFVLLDKNGNRGQISFVGKSSLTPKNPLSFQFHDGYWFFKDANKSSTDENYVAFFSFKESYRHPQTTVEDCIDNIFTYLTK
jgi:hypothetical protein